MPRLGTIELGIAQAYLKQADDATDPEWERMWLDLAMTRLLCAQGDEAFNERVTKIYQQTKARYETLSIELGYRQAGPPAPAEPGTLRYIIEQQRTAAQQGGV